MCILRFNSKGNFWLLLILAWGRWNRCTIEFFQRLLRTTNWTLTKLISPQCFILQQLFVVFFSFYGWIDWGFFYNFYTTISNQRQTMKNLCSSISSTLIHICTNPVPNNYPTIMMPFETLRHHFSNATSYTEYLDVSTWINKIGVCLLYANRTITLLIGFFHDCQYTWIYLYSVHLI